MVQGDRHGCIFAPRYHRTGERNRSGKQSLSCKQAQRRGFDLHALTYGYPMQDVGDDTDARETVIVL